MSNGHTLDCAAIGAECEHGGFYTLEADCNCVKKEARELRKRLSELEDAVNGLCPVCELRWRRLMSPVAKPRII